MMRKIKYGGMYVLAALFVLLSTYAGGGFWRKAPTVTHWLNRRLVPALLVLFALNAALYPLSHLADGIFALLMWPPVFAAQRHSDFLCPSCAADFPLDAQAKAQEKRSELRHYHKHVLFLCAAYLIVVGGNMFVPWSRTGWEPSAVSAAAVLLLMAPVWRWSRVHGELQPWCPWCRRGRGGGGDDVLEPEPDPGIKLPA